MWNTWFLRFIKIVVTWIKNTEDLKEKYIIHKGKNELLFFMTDEIKYITFVAPSACTDIKNVLSGFWNHRLHKPTLDYHGIKTCKLKDKLLFITCQKNQLHKHHL